MKRYEKMLFEGERALYSINNAEIVNCVFDNGESPLKECKNLKITGSEFKYKYPIWYSNNVEVTNCKMSPLSRAGIWYTNNIVIKDSEILSPKNFRRCDGITLENVDMMDAAETLWMCRNIKFINVKAKGDYLAMNSENIEIDNLDLDGNYAFDGGKNITIRNSKLLTKDAFWNSENVTVYDSYISGEYLGWNSKNLTIINCTIESLQGLCYIDNLTMKNCKLVNTTLCFEYVKNINADIVSKIDSVFNPINGTISATEIEKLIMEKDFVDPSKTKIICQKIGQKEEVIEWRR